MREAAPRPLCQLPRRSLSKPGRPTINLTDAVFTLNHLFLGGPAPDCADAADADDNGDLEITDAVYTLNFLFLGGAEIPEPAGAECGVDPTDDELICGTYERCP